MDLNSILSTQVIASLITALVTLVGIIVSYRLSKTNLENEIRSIKTQHAIERMQDLPSRTASLFDEMRNGALDVEGMSRLLSDIYAYGSPDAVKILASFQETNFSVSSNTGKSGIEQSYYILGHIALLISQLKYDLSGQIVDPELYFKIKISDYGKNGITAGPILRALASNLNLSSDLFPDRK